jgi:hypothetical protein
MEEEELIKKPNLEIHPIVSIIILEISNYSFNYYFRGMMLILLFDYCSVIFN